LILATALAHGMRLLTCDRRLADRARDLGHGDEVEDIASDGK
jgi:predicted nucleic acid-binding protein